MKRAWLGVLVCALIPSHVHAAMGIAMRFVDVTLENVQPGASINLRVARHLPLVVMNQSEIQDTDILVEPMTPQAKEMKEGYEPMPDPTWIKAVPNRFHLGPKASAAADVVLEIPNDPKYIGHHYEVILWVHMDDKNKAKAKGGVIFQVGLRSRFRVSIGTMGPESLQREKALKKLATINTDFSVSPDNLFVREIPLGVWIDLKTEKRAGLKIVNQSDDPVSLKIRPVPADPNIRPQIGYEDAPDYKWLEVTPQTPRLKGNTIKELRLRVNVPDKPEFRGKNYMFLILTTLDDESMPVAYYNMVYVATKP